MLVLYNVGMASAEHLGPQWDFGWKGRKYNEWGESEKHILHPDNPKELSTVFVHSEGPGMGIVAPSDRDYSAVIAGRFTPMPTNDERKWGIGPRNPLDKNGEPYARDYSLRSVKEHVGLKDFADRLYDSLEFMKITGVDEVDHSNDENPAITSEIDLAKNLYDKRPSFPKTFQTASRATHVAELLIKRRDANIPITSRKPRR